MSVTVQCDEARLQEYYCSERSLFVKIIYGSIRRYGIIALLITGLPPIIFGVMGWSVGILLLWLVVSYYLIGWLRVTITKDIIRRNLTWGSTKVKVRKSSIQYSSARGVSLSYYTPCYTSFSSSASRFFLGNKRTQEEIIVPAERCQEIVEQISQMIDPQSSKEAFLPHSEYVYRGMRAPSMVVKGVLSSITPWSVSVYVLLLVVSCICFSGLEIIGIHDVGIIAWPSTFLAIYALLIRWMYGIDSKKVTLTYAFRKRAVVIRSSDGWVAVIPYMQMDTLYTGRKYNMLQIVGGQMIPFSKTFPDERLKSLKIKRLKSGGFVSLLLSILTLYILNTIYIVLLMIISGYPT